MAPPRNLRRRNALADAAIEILGTAGIHKLSHRAVDEQAGLPVGTASNYFACRDDLLKAAVSRVAELQLARMTSADSQVTGPVGADQLAELIGSNLYRSATEDRVRSLALYELTLEASRQPELAQEMTRLGADALTATIAEHRALGLPTTPDQVQALMTLFGGVLLSLVTGPLEAVTRPAVLALAQCLVNGVLNSSPVAGEARLP
ncbi:MAG TPA: TetR/AcrR family transcriptional regulator [Streptosporangiaceae bacterium]|jgi:DNA-binding transcriptional regulator YbjK